MFQEGGSDWPRLRHSLVKTADWELLNKGCRVPMGRGSIVGSPECQMSTTEVKKFFRKEGERCVLAAAEME